MPISSSNVAFGFLRRCGLQAPNITKFFGNGSPSNVRSQVISLNRP
ncbi:unnamed protein product, partial [Rotaria magnacalcarata]